MPNNDLLGLDPQIYEPLDSEGQNGEDPVTDQSPELTDQAKQKGQQLAQKAKDEAGNLQQTVTSAGEQVAGVAKEQAVRVAGEAGEQARGLLDQGMQEARSQAAAGQQQLTGALQGLVAELDAMAHHSDAEGPLTSLAAEAAARGDQLVDWLSGHQPEELLDEVRSYARQHPWMFLAGAATLGILMGRLTRGLTADSGRSSQPNRAPQPSPARQAADDSAATTGQEVSDIDLRTPGYVPEGSAWAEPTTFDPAAGETIESGYLPAGEQEGRPL